MKPFVFFISCLLCTGIHAQKQDELTAEDSIAIINQLKEDLKLLLGKNQQSFGEVSAGIGSGNFWPLYSQHAPTLQKQTVYNLNGGYYHKSGFGIDARGLFTHDQGNMKMFQASVSPSYMYSKNKKFVAGAGYTRFMYGSDLSFATSPLQNEWQLFGRLRKLLLQPGLSVHYAHGIYKEEVQAQGSDPGYTYTEKASDIGLVASVRHHFTWLKILNEDDAIRFTPSLVTLAGTSRYGMNLAMTSAGSNFIRTNINPPGWAIAQANRANRGNGNGNGNGNSNGSGNGNGQGPPFINPSNPVNTTVTYEQDYNTGFRLQSATIVLGAEYNWKNFFIQPQCLTDFSFAATGQKWVVLFNLTAGITL